MRVFMYILECSDGSYYVGSTRDVDKRLIEHEVWDGARFTRDKLPVKLVYYEEYDRIDDAFYHERQIKGWTRKKKLALITGNIDLLKAASTCKNASSHLKYKPEQK